MAFSGHYFCGALNGSSTIDKVPLYYLPSDILPYCDAAVEVSVPGAYLGHLYAPAKDPSLSEQSRGFRNIDHVSSSLVQNFEGSLDKYDDIYTIPISGGTNGTIVKNLSAIVNFYCSYGATSDGWCHTFIQLKLDDTVLTESYKIVRSMGGVTRQLSISTSNINIGAGDHVLRLGAFTHASEGDGAYFRVNWFSLSCDPIKRHCTPSIMHTVSASTRKELILCKNFG